MKKPILFVAALFFSASSFSQIFTDNFDSYIAGDFLVSSNPAKWDTWSGGAGGSTEDAKISDVESASGSNSLYLKAATANGGPSDIILRFDEVYDAGNFTLEANFFVVQNKGAYFNLQQDHTPGNVWAIDCHMLNDGTLHFASGGTKLLNTTYPNGAWFNLRMEINLTSNDWEIFIDDVSQGVFSNPITSIGILDLFPVNPATSGGNGQSEFYVDDVMYNHTPAVLPQLNGGVSFVNQLEGIAGQSANVEAKVRNLGTDDITSFDITYTYGGTPVTESVSGITLTSLEFYDFTFPTPTTLIAGSNVLSVKISNVNGAGQDGDATDDEKTVTINPVTPAPGRIVVGEEATGTWCTWCPRGAVFMEYMATKYDGFWAGVAVHNNDPMVVSIYDAGIAGKVSGLPSALVDRGGSIDPSEMEADFIERIVIAPKAVITNGASFDPATRELKVTLTYDFSSAISGNWKVACVLTEDGVTGTTSGYNQVNGYAGGNSGVMGGYENLPNPVPAAQMVYDHVARKIAPSFAGDATLLPTSVTSGDKHTVCFTFTLPASWDETKMHIVGMLINPSGRIDNGSFSSIADAQTNGLAAECNAVASLETNEIKSPGFIMYPNPTSDVVYIDMINANGEEVALMVTDLAGKVVAERTYNIEGDVKLPINTNGFAKGTYIVHLKRNGTVQQQKLIVQ